MMPTSRPNGAIVKITERRPGAKRPTEVATAKHAAPISAAACQLNMTLGTGHHGAPVHARALAGHRSFRITLPVTLRSATSASASPTSSRGSCAPM